MMGRGTVFGLMRLTDGARPVNYYRAALGAINGAVWGSMVAVFLFTVLFNFLRG